MTRNLPNIWREDQGRGTTMA